jgi:hypothetical protein
MAAIANALEPRAAAGDVRETVRAPWRCIEQPFMRRHAFASAGRR